MAKPDDRSDNVEKLQEAVKNTVGNLTDAEDYLEAHKDEIGKQEQRAINVKNEHRRESMEGMRDEISDEAEARDNKS